MTLHGIHGARLRTAVLGALPLVVIVAARAAAADVTAPEGYTPLFNGRDLAGWRGRPHLDPREDARGATPSGRSGRGAGMTTWRSTGRWPTG